MLETEVITYSLRSDRKCACTFSGDCFVFTDEVIAAGERQLEGLVNAYLTFLQETRREAARSRPEYLFELLVMGVLWHVYGNNAMVLSEATARLLAGLADLREQKSWLKKPVDLARGLLALQLRPFHSFPAAPPPLSSVDRLERLLLWMAAGGRFTQETRRLRGWKKFLASLPPEQAGDCLLAATDYAAWFENRSLEALGAYTPNVEQFLAISHPGYRWREDFVLCGRKRVEYHLNMVGTEILNRALRADFLRTRKKAVLAPPCMRARPDDGPPDLRCKAVSTPLGARCTACTPGCRVHQLTKLGKKHHFAVFILPDDLRVFTGASVPHEDQEPTGIVGISCVLTNVQGGWDVRELGIPAQGLPLDYCGCRYHWHKHGIPTAIDFHQLLQMMGIANHGSE